MMPGGVSASASAVIARTRRRSPPTASSTLLTSLMPQAFMELEVSYSQSLRPLLQR